MTPKDVWAKNQIAERGAPVKRGPSASLRTSRYEGNERINDKAKKTGTAQTMTESVTKRKETAKALAATVAA
jgi:hypothetical protein